MSCSVTSGCDPVLSKRDRSLIMVAMLVALYRADQLRGHIRRAEENGVTRDENAEVITHVAFYAGWPTAANAVGVAKDAYDKASVACQGMGVETGDKEPIVLAVAAGWTIRLPPGGEPGPSEALTDLEALQQAHPHEHGQRGERDRGDQRRPAGEFRFQREAGGRADEVGQAQHVLPHRHPARPVEEAVTIASQTKT